MFIMSLNFITNLWQHSHCNKYVMPPIAWIAKERGLSLNELSQLLLQVSNDISIKMQSGENGLSQTLTIAGKLKALNSYLHQVAAH